jgi:hypothetical protein
MYCCAVLCGRNTLPEMPASNWFGRCILRIKRWFHSRVLCSKRPRPAPNFSTRRRRWLTGIPHRPYTRSDYNFSTLRTAVILCCCPGARLIAASTMWFGIPNGKCANFSQAKNILQATTYPLDRAVLEGLLVSELLIAMFAHSHSESQLLPHLP